MDDHVMTWVKLAKCPGLSPARFWKLLNQCNTPDAVIAYLDQQQQGGMWSNQNVIDYYDKCQQMGIQWLLPYQSHFPSLLTDIPDCPLMLEYLGQLSCLDKPLLAIVGGRQCSINGAKFIERLSLNLAQNGFSIVSGMAKGIDGAAHHGALDFGTVAVLAGGVDVIYPPEHALLYKNIASQGLIISEMPQGHPIMKGLFPKRNRIIAGLAMGLVVCEATTKSGSLITAHLAMNYNRDIFAVPGHPCDPRSSGCLNLIKQGAMLIETVDDILDVYKNFLRPTKSMTVAPSDDDSLVGESPHDLYQLILQRLSHTPTMIDDVIQDLPYPKERILTILSQMELNDDIIKQQNYLILKR
jgi:DNA processing protein